nr:NAD(P)-dependent oxidoreductase [uncultured Acidocella sp.]
MSRTVLVTATKLAPEASALLKEAGLTLVFTDAYPDEASLLALIQEHRPCAILHRQGLIDTTIMDAAAPELLVVARHGAGLDGVDLTAAKARNLTVVRAAGANAPAVAEHTLALLLACLKQLPAIAAGMREGKWEKSTRITRDLNGLVLGIVGYGAIGRRVATLASAFGAEILAYDPYLPQGALSGPGERSTDLNAMLARCEALSMHCPLNAETRHMIGATELALLPKGAVLVNAARGGVVDEAALLAALDAGQIAAAGIDVFETEPVQIDNRLRTHPQVIATPHVAASSRQGGLAMAIGAADGIVSALARRAPKLPGAVTVPGSLLGGIVEASAA